MAKMQMPKVGAKPKPAPKLEMVANRVVGAAPKASKPMATDVDPSQIKPGHHKY